MFIMASEHDDDFVLVDLFPDGGSEHSHDSNHVVEDKGGSGAQQQGSEQLQQQTASGASHDGASVGEDDNDDDKNVDVDEMFGVQTLEDALRQAEEEELKLASARERISVAKTEILEVTTSHQALQEQLQSCRTQTIATQAALTAAQAQHSSLCEQLQRHTAQHEELQIQIEAAEARTKELNVQKAEVDQRAKQLRALQTASDKVGSATEAAKAAMHAARAAQNVATASAARAEAQAAQAEARANAAEARAERAKARREAAERRGHEEEQRLLKAIALAKKGAQDAARRVDELDAQLQQANEESLQLQAQLQVAKAEHLQTTFSLQRVREGITACEREEKQLQLQLVAAHHRVVAKRSKVNALSKQSSGGDDHSHTTTDLEAGHGSRRSKPASLQPGGRNQQRGVFRLLRAISGLARSGAVSPQQASKLKALVFDVACSAEGGEDVATLPAGAAS